VPADDESVDQDRRALYRRCRDEQWAFVRENFFDERHGGIRELPMEPASPWPWRRHAGPPPVKSHGWKDISHEVATFLALGGGAS